MSDTELTTDDPTITRKPAPSRIKAPLLVAIDDGLAQTKLLGDGPDGQPRILKIPTSIRAASAGAMVDLSGDLVGMYRTAEGEEYVCSAGIPSEETRHPDFHVSQIDRVLVNHALIEAGYSGQDVVVLTALPVDEYFAGGQVNRVRIDRKIANLKAGVAMMGSQSAMPRIVDVKVGCQGLAAFFDFTLDDHGKPRGEALESVVVVDIGGSTTDIVSIVRGGQTIDQSASGAARLGVLDVHSQFTERLTAEMGFPVRLTPAAIDRACRTGSIRLNRQDRDVSNIVRDAVADVGGRIVREVERRIGKAATVDAVLFVGGGAGLFKDVVQHWSGVEVIADGEMANARGLLKYARSRG